jgi:hypothetical protein
VCFQLSATEGTAATSASRVQAPPVELPEGHELDPQSTPGRTVKGLHVLVAEVRRLSSLRLTETSGYTRLWLPPLVMCHSRGRRVHAEVGTWYSLRKQMRTLQRRRVGIIAPVSSCPSPRGALKSCCRCRGRLLLLQKTCTCRSTAFEMEECLRLKTKIRALRLAELADLANVCSHSDCLSSLVQDNHVNQMVATRILRSLGCTFDVVDNGRKAVAACMAGNYDVVLMDCHMPDMVSCH